LKNQLFITCIYLSSVVNAQQVFIDVRHRPPEIVVKNAQVSGPIREIIERLFSKKKVELNWQSVPWPRTMSRAINGKVDIIPRHSLNREREQFLLPMLIGFEQRQITFLLAPTLLNTTEMQTLSQFKGLIFGFLRKSYYSRSLDTMHNDSNIVYANSIEQLMEMLLAGRIDILPIQNITWAEEAYEKVRGKHPNKYYTVAPYKENFISGKYISIPKASNSSKFYHEFNCLLFNMRKSGTIDNIYRRFSIPVYLQLFDKIESKTQQASCMKEDEEQ